jgi:hypothetical protein
MESLYETFGNESSYTVRQGKLVKFLENSTIAFPIPEASVDILTTMLDPEQDGIEATRIDTVKARLINIGFDELTTNALAIALIKIAKMQGVHPMSYFDMNDDAIRLAADTYAALNTVRPKGNLVGLTSLKDNSKSRVSKTIRP